LIERYPFTGVFLDKIRFPSPANGLEEVASCFCDHCHDAAKAIDLDLEDVAQLFEYRARMVDTIQVDGDGHRNWHWLAALVPSDTLLGRFLRFRMDCIAGLVAEAQEISLRAGKRVSADLFSPGLAPLVGQDYRAFARYCDWIKPMTYRLALGPAGLRLEVPALVDGISRMFGIDEDKIAEWAARNVPGFDRDTLDVTRENAVPLALI
jgi:hypothetical protein